MTSSAVCSATILLLAVALFASVSSASHPSTAVEATDHAITKEKTELLPVHHDRDKEEMEEAKVGGRQDSSAAEKIMSLVSAEEEGKKAGSYLGKAKKLDDDDDDNDDSDQESDSDHDHNSDSDHDHDSDSDHDHDHDSDLDHDHNHDSDHEHDHDSDSDHDRDHDSDSGDNDDDDDDDDDDNDDDNDLKNERNKHAAQGRKRTPGGKLDDKLSKVAKKV